MRSGQHTAYTNSKSDNQMLLESSIDVAYSHHLFHTRHSLSLVFCVTPSSRCISAASKSSRNLFLDGLGKILKKSAPGKIGGESIKDVRASSSKSNL
jgi:hypothetical protein